MWMRLGGVQRGLEARPLKLKLRRGMLELLLPPLRLLRIKRDCKQNEGGYQKFMFNDLCLCSWCAG